FVFCEIVRLRPTRALSLPDALPVWRAAGGEHGAGGGVDQLAVEAEHLCEDGGRQRFAGRPVGDGGAASDDHDAVAGAGGQRQVRSEEHTSELQLREEVVCRLLLEKK